MNKLCIYLAKNKKFYSVKKFSKNSVVLYENDFFPLIIFVLKGNLVAETNQFDNPLIFNYFKTNDFIGNNLIFSNEKILKGNIICKTACELLYLRKDEFLQILCSSKVFLEEYLTYCSNIIRNEKTLIKCLKIPNIRNRILYYIQQNNGSIYYANITSLSKILSTSRENLSRIIANLVKENIIIKEKNFMRLKR